jgi:hypothetical protein
MALPEKIAIVGVRGSGKSTVANMLSVGYAYKPVGFADPIKEACRLIFGFDDETLYGPSSAREKEALDFPHSGHCFTCDVQCLSVAIPDGDESFKWRWECPQCHELYSTFVTCREACKTLGTAWGRRLSPNLWVTALLKNTKGRIAIYDCRFRNEYELAQKHGAFVIILTREADASTDPHPSEAEPRALVKAALDNSLVGNYMVIDNANMTLEETQRAIEDVMNVLARFSASQQQVAE